MRGKEWTILCPDCGQRIRIDGKTGELIAHGLGDKPSSLDEAARQRELRQDKKKDAFANAMEAEKGRSAELDHLFKKASEEVESSEDESGSRPDNPMEDRWR